MAKTLYFKLSFVLLATWLLSQIIFLQADADSRLSPSRGPFTDEGLNTCQVRNLVNHGYLDFRECDNLIKTPAFSAYLALPFTIFGTYRLTGRLTVLLCCFLLYFLIIKNTSFRQIFIFFIPIALFRYPIHQFSHFCMAEMLASALVLFGVHRYSKFLEEPPVSPLLVGGIKGGPILAQTLIFLAFLTKIQFGYIILLIPLHSLFLFLKKPGDKLFQKVLIYSWGYLLIQALLFFLAWYLPLKDVFQLMFRNQSGQLKFDENTWNTVDYMVNFVLLNSENAWYTILFTVSWILGFVLLFLKNKSSSYFYHFTITSLWILLEAHKLTMAYLPTRYLVSAYFAMGLLIALVLRELFFHNKRQSRVLKLISRGLVIAGLAVAIYYNGIDFQKAFSDRTYVTKELDDYLARGDLEKEDTAIGPWAPALCWKSRARTIPVWNNWLNYEDPINTYRPRVVISEPNEPDSDKAYRSQGIDLWEISDSVKQTAIGDWPVEIFWIREKN